MVHVAPSSKLVMEWQARLQRSQDELGRESSARAWHWAVQAKVLRFVLARYSDTPEIERTDALRESNLPGHRLFFLFNAFGIGKKPRSRETIRRTLEQIAAVNRTVKR